MYARPFAIMAVAVLLAGACTAFGTTGTGPLKSESRSLGTFTRVDVSGGIGLTMHVGPVQTVQISAQENLLPIIATEVQAGVLKIHSTQSFSTSAGVQATVVMPALDGISLSGGSVGQVDGLAAANLDIAVGGGAGLSAAGTAGDVTLDASGGAHASLDNLAAKTFAVSLSGGATATLNAADRVTGSASGGAHATVIGGAQLDVQTSGGADVSRQ